MHVLARHLRTSGTTGGAGSSSGATMLQETIANFKKETGSSERYRGCEG